MKLRFRHAQRGAILVVAMVMLVIISLIGISSVKLSTAHARIVGNFQYEKEAESLAQRAIDQIVSTIAYFNTPANTPGSMTIDGQVVTIEQKPTCIAATPAEGYSALQKITPENTFWEIRASTTDSVTGAAATVSQGVKTRLTAGACP